LATLIAEHGSYAQIPRTAWAEFDNAMAQWRAARLARLRDLQGRNLDRYRASARTPPVQARSA
jgi:hypothetical protein